MVVFVTLPAGAGHVGYFLNRYGHAHARKMAEIAYHDLARRSSVPGGVYVFCDRERMSEVQRKLAIRLWDQLAVGGESVRLLNNPRTQLSRFDLLNKLHQEDINDFRAFRADALPKDLRWPVFVRQENDHAGPKSGLIHNSDDLWRAIAQGVLGGANLRDVLVVEYVDAVSPDGAYRKYGAYRVGGRIFGQHLLLGTEWSVKSDKRHKTPQAQQENRDYFLQNPHRDLLMPYFEMAGIEYGRVDYAFVDGRIQIWEINDNPQFVSKKPLRLSNEGKEFVYLEALEALEALQGGPPCPPRPIPLDAFGSGFWEEASSASSSMEAAPR